MQIFPKWATPERRGYLAMRKVVSHRDLAGWEVDLLTGEMLHPGYEKLQEMLLHEWVADDREERNYLRRLEQERLHPVERIRQGRFDSIARDIFLAEQPTHYLEAVGIDALRRQPVAKVRLASSPVRLWVDVPAPIPELPPAPEGGWSKNALRRFRRYGKGPIAQAINQAVSDYHNSPD